MRNLAEVCTIKSVEKIVYKDTEYTKVQKYTLHENAYEFVAQAGLKVGQKVVFIGEGALIPASNSYFEFLRDKCYSQKYDAFRVKAVKMCGFISQGILCGMDVLKKDYPIGSDVTDVLGIKKYEDIEDASPKKQKGLKCFIYKYLPKLARLIWSKSQSEDFPSWLIPKTDETNIENIVPKLSQYADRPYYVTAKVEGQSGTWLLDKNKFVVCSRNHSYSKECDNNYWNIAKSKKIENMLRSELRRTGFHLAIQGEIVGPGIQKNIYNYENLELYVFNIKNLDTNKFIDYYEMARICKAYNLMTVPLLFTGNELKNFITEETLNKVKSEYVEKSAFRPAVAGKIADFYAGQAGDVKIDNKKVFHNEGLVIRTVDQEFSCKFKSAEYMLWFYKKDGE